MLANLTLRAKALVAIAAAVAAYVVLMPDTAQTVEPTRPGRAAQGGETPTRGAAAPHMIKPAAPSRLLEASVRLSERIVEGASAASLFSPQSWYVAPPAPPPVPVAYQPPPAPSAPPLPFAFMGSYKTESGSTYFLTAGDRVYDVKVGDTLDNTYSVDAVKSGQMLLTYMPLKIQQSLAVGDQQ